MTKRNPGLPRSPRDDYPTPLKAVLPLLPGLAAEKGKAFAEPCAGAGKLVGHLCASGFTCVYQGDISQGQDALNYRPGPDVQMIITNPPWERKFLHKLIGHLLLTGVPVWLLIDADWAHTKQASEYLQFCTHIVSIGRVRWMEGTTMDGYDNAAWYRFSTDPRSPAFPYFIPRFTL
jgi:hypothetical protein